MRTLVLGGARSGKSSRAEWLTKKWAVPSKIYIATYKIDRSDEEMLKRVRLHQERRGPEWETLETVDNLPEMIRQLSGQNKAALLDCATMWLAGILEKGEDEINKRCQDLEEAVSSFDGELIVVANEVGQGLVPPDPIARLFRDCNGRLNQAMARVVDRVEFVVAGIPTVLKENV